MSKRKNILVVSILALCLILVSITSYQLGAGQMTFFNNSSVENVILLIGDGMGLAQVNAARISAYGADGKLNMHKMPVSGLCITHSANSLVTDSAAAATAMATGYKTDNSKLSVDPDGKKLVTIMEAAKAKGLFTGLVATKSITDATPAAFASHVESRNQHENIAEQILKNNINVIFGGGSDYFLPYSKGGIRSDGKDLLSEAEKKGYTVIKYKDEVKSVKRGNAIGLFAMNNMAMTPGGNDLEPSLEEMTKKAIELLEQEKNGFFLMVEGSQIDTACHGGDNQGTYDQVLDFDKAVKAAVDFAEKDGNTLVVVVADHETGGMVINGGSLDGKELDIYWSTSGHSAMQVPIFAYGPEAIRFTGVHDNTEIPVILSDLLEISDKEFPKMQN